MNTSCFCLSVGYIPRNGSAEAVRMCIQTRELHLNDNSLGSHHQNNEISESLNKLKSQFHIENSNIPNQHQTLA